MFLALGWHLKEIHVAWAHLEKKWTRLRLYTKSFEETMHTGRGDGVAITKRQGQDFHNDDAKDLMTALERSQLKVAIEYSTANVSNVANQKKHKPKVKKSKKLGSNERLASSKPMKPKTYLRWSPTERIFDLSGQLIVSSESECQSDSSEGDNACASNPQEPTNKRFPNSTSFLG
ncbi:hypothetical protein Tco_1206390, partial [Tanacetum coccineum]